MQTHTFTHFACSHARHTPNCSRKLNKYNTFYQIFYVSRFSTFECIILKICPYLIQLSEHHLSNSFQFVYAFMAFSSTLIYSHLLHLLNQFFLRTRWGQGKRAIPFQAYHQLVHHLDFDHHQFAPDFHHPHSFLLNLLRLSI